MVILYFGTSCKLILFGLISFILHQDLLTGSCCGSKYLSGDKITAQHNTQYVAPPLCNCPGIKQFACRLVFRYAHTHTHTHTQAIICTSVPKLTLLPFQHTHPYSNLKVNDLFDHLHNILIFLLGKHSSFLIQDGAM